MDTSSTWTLVYNRFEPAQEGLREALCTLGNGYFATRGAAPEVTASKIHYPGTYIAGLYNKLATRIAGRTVFNEDLVNCPNWLFLTIRIGDGEWFHPSMSRLLSFRQELNMREGVLYRRLRFQNHDGRITLVETRRIVHMGKPHLGAIEYTVTPENYNGWVTVRSMLDGAVLNTGVERYRQLNSKHWEPYSSGSFSKNGVYLVMMTNQSKIKVVQAAKIKVFAEGKEIKPILKPVIRRLMEGKERIGQEFKIFARKNCSYTIEKNVCLYTSKDKNIRNPITAAIESAKKSPRFSTLLDSHRLVWKNLWDKCDINIEGDNFSEWVLRLHMFHLLQTASLNTTEIDTSIPARGLHGEAYRGHIFWDELFIMPFYDFHFPEISKSLLLYRYRRLPKAREYARKNGYKGAMFPWQSASSGGEETQVLHLNPLSGKWGMDYSRLQRHVSFAVAYNVWQYWERTGDFDFLLHYGAEIILSVAQFGASLAYYDYKGGKYHTKGVMGPDEFHEKYPWSHKPGLKDNAYTNLMIVYTLLKAKKLLTFLPDRYKRNLKKKLHITNRDVALWDDIVQKMNVVISKKGVISQFDGYFRLKDLDWKEYRGEYGNTQRMDRILKAEGKSPDAYKVTKQADALMIFYLLTLSEIKEILKTLGYNFDAKKLKKTYEYYIKRTTHGSTLSKVVHCYVALLLGKAKESWWWFLETLESDIYDTQRGTTPEGIHTGVMGGTVDIVMRGFAGLKICDGRVKLEPHLPENWRKIKLRFLYQGNWVSLILTKRQVTIFLSEKRSGFPSIKVEIKGKLYPLLPGKRVCVSF